MSRLFQLKCFVAVTLALLSGFGWAAENASNYPSRPITLLLAYPAGGLADVVARIITEPMSKSWGQPIVVEPKPGANGYIAASALKEAKPDGYTLMVGSMFLVVAPLIDPNANFKTSDFTPVSLVAGQPNIFVVPSSLPVRTLKEFVEYAKQRPGQLNTAAMGTGGSNHLGIEAFQQATGIQLTKIKHKGAPPVVPDLLQGQLSIVLGPVNVLAPHVKSGKLRVLAVNSLERIDTLPEAPTLIEAGFGQDVVVVAWYGVVAPPGTPTEIVTRINAEFNKALKTPEVVQKLKAIDVFVMGGSPSDFGQLLRSEQIRWAKLVKERNIRPE